MIEDLEQYLFSQPPLPLVNAGSFICNLRSHVPSDNIVVINHFNSLMRIELTTHICRALYSLQRVFQHITVTLDAP